MIKNERQYIVTKSRLRDFRESLHALENQQMDPLLKELHEEALKSQIEVFENQIREYEFLKEGSISYVQVEDLSHIYEALIKGRIAKKMTQADLAEKLELKEQQIQRYEMTNYSAASFSRIMEVANALGLKIEKLKVKVKETFFQIPDDVDNDKIVRIRTEKLLLRL